MRIVMAINTYVSGSFNQIETQLNDHIIFAAQNIRYFVGNPSVNFVNTGYGDAADTKSRATTHFFMTCRFTFCMSTFLLNSGGNLVDFKSLASVLDAIFGGVDCWRRPGCRSSFCDVGRLRVNGRLAGGRI